MSAETFDPIDDHYCRERGCGAIFESTPSYPAHDQQIVHRLIRHGRTTRTEPCSRRCSYLLVF